MIKSVREAPLDGNTTTPSATDVAKEKGEEEKDMINNTAVPTKTKTMPVETPVEGQEQEPATEEEEEDDDNEIDLTPTTTKYTFPSESLHCGDNCDGWEAILKTATENFVEPKTKTADELVQEEEAANEDKEEQQQKMEEEKKDEEMASTVDQSNKTKNMEDQVKSIIFNACGGDSCHGWETLMKAAKFSTTGNDEDEEDGEPTTAARSMMDDSEEGSEDAKEEAASKEEIDQDTTLGGMIPGFEFVIDNPELKKLITLIVSIPDTAKATLEDATKIWNAPVPNTMASTDEEADDHEDEDSDYEASGEKDDDEISVGPTDVDNIFELIQNQNWKKLEALFKAYPEAVDRTVGTGALDEERGQVEGKKDDNEVEEYIKDKKIEDGEEEDKVESSRENKLKEDPPEAGSAAAQLPAPTPKGNSVLHEVCKNQPPLTIVTHILELTKSAKDATREFCSTLGYLPLHYACSNGASVEVIQHLIEVHPESVRQRVSSTAMLPLHLATKSGASKAVLLALIPSYPSAMQIQDKGGKIPFAYVAEGSNTMELSLQELCDAVMTTVETTKLECEKGSAMALKRVEQVHNTYVDQLKKNNEDVLSSIAGLALDHQIKEKNLRSALASEAVKVGKLENELKEQVQQKKEKERVVEEREKVILSKEATILQLEETISSKQTTIENMENQFNLHEQAYTALLAKEQSRLKELEAQTVLLKIKAGATDTELTRAKKQVDDLTSLLKRREKKLASIRGIIADSVEQADSMDDDIREQPHAQPTKRSVVSSSAKKSTLAVSSSSPNADPELQRKI